MKFKADTSKKRKNIGLIIFIVMLSALYLVGMGAMLKGCSDLRKNVKESYDRVFGYEYDPLTSNPSDLGYESKKDDEIVNIALFGVDTRTPKSFTGRSDSIMILSVNKTKNKVKLISVLRDSFVPIERDWGINYTKINSAYASGGPELAIKTLNQVFQLDISEYATVNFYGMADIIDSMGGVTVPVTDAEVYQINLGVIDACVREGLNPDDYRITKSGTQRLNGIQAVSYSRIRYVANADGTSNDYGRTDRQRYVLTQLFKSVTSKTKKEYVNLISALSPYCITSLSHSEILDIAVDVLMESPTLEETRVPFIEYVMRTPQTNAGAVNYYDLNFAANIIHAFIYEDIKPEKFIELNGVEKNDWYSKGYSKPKIVSYKERKETIEKKKAEQAASNTASGSASTPEQE